MEDRLKSAYNFEIDSRCPGSTMVKAVNDNMGADSILNYGTWAYLGSGTNASRRYLFWTSVNTNEVGAGQDIPVIVQTTDGKYYISQTTTAARSAQYVAIADHMDLGKYKDYLDSNRQYGSLDEAYQEYEKLLTTGEFQQYKDTLIPKQ